jgi:hypothetical protein
VSAATTVHRWVTPGGLRATRCARSPTDAPALPVVHHRERDVGRGRPSPVANHATDADRRLVGLPGRREKQYRDALMLVDGVDQVVEGDSVSRDGAEWNRPWRERGDRLTAMSIASPSECSSDADCTHRSTSPSARPPARKVSSRTGHSSPGAYGVRAPRIRDPVLHACLPPPTRPAGHPAGSLSATGHDRWPYPPAVLLLVDRCPRSARLWPFRCLSGRFRPAMTGIRHM